MAPFSHIHVPRREARAPEASMQDSSLRSFTQVAAEHCPLYSSPSVATVMALFRANFAFDRTPSARERERERERELFYQRAQPYLNKIYIGKY